MYEIQTSPAVNEQPVPVLEKRKSGYVRCTILLVEDEALVRDVTCEILEVSGYRVLKARNATEAMGAFRRCRGVVKLLLTDVVLPGRSGRDLAYDLRVERPGLRTIFTSGYPENAVTRSGIEEDGMFYLPKPYSFQSLTRKVSQVLDTLVAGKRKRRVI
jgi:DNA-binding NtrC family response regulator